jgi:citrate lyase beta subunit
LGCDGKWAIHPAQLDPINQIFSPTEAELNEARRLHDRYMRALGDEQTGAITLGGELVDAASLRLAERILARGRAAGMLGE